MIKSGRGNILFLFLMLALLLTGCNQSSGIQNSEFTQVKPSEMGTRDYWELTRTFNELSQEFINAVYSLDWTKSKEMVKDEEVLNEFQLEEALNVVHLKQQTVNFERGYYNCIMQVGIEDTSYVYFHIFFDEADDQWQIADIQFDA